MYMNLGKTLVPFFIVQSLPFSLKKGPQKGAKNDTFFTQNGPFFDLWVSKKCNKVKPQCNWVQSRFSIAYKKSR